MLTAQRCVLICVVVSNYMQWPLILARLNEALAKKEYTSSLYICEKIVVKRVRPGPLLPIIRKIAIIRSASGDFFNRFPDNGGGITPSGKISV